MYRPRLIPVLLLHQRGLVKSRSFTQYEYVGDPINAVRIFNDARVDELVILDIDATAQGRCVDLNWVKMIAEEAEMPLAIGGGISNTIQMQQIIDVGVEKVILGTLPILNEREVEKGASILGSSSIVACVDVRKNNGNWSAFYKNGRVAVESPVKDYLKRLENMGVGEIILQDIDGDGQQRGYNQELFIDLISDLSVPVIACGGANSINNMKELYNKTNVAAMAAGSLFVHKGRWRAVLINYPDESVKSTFIEEM
jgi:imidazole glycerol-phosphate synthase subunit HisF